MVFNKSTFLPAMAPAEQAVRITDADGQTKYLLRDPDATLLLSGRAVHIRQRADTAAIVLDFLSPREAREAMTAIQQALSQIRRNKSDAVPASSSGDVLRYYIKPTQIGQSGFNLSFQPESIAGLFVNGQLMDNQSGQAYNIINTVLNWTSDSFQLDPEDVLLLEYYLPA